MPVVLAALAIALRFAGSPAIAVASAQSGLAAAEEQAFRKAALAVSKSVVRIQTVGGLDRVGGMLAGTAATTGVVVSEDGLIVSSAFNFVAKPTSIFIQLDDGQRRPATLVATDRLRMLTLLKIDSGGLVPLRPRNDKTVRVGQWAVAVGRTYDSREPSVSIGIVSAINRVWGKAIQTDAKVSPVNYGGPLVDVRGDVLGVVVPLSPSGKEEAAGVEWYDSGIGFAIPYEDVLASVERLKAGKDLLPGLLGVIIKDTGAGDHAAIDMVRFDSPAERAGLKAGDIILDIDGRAVRRQDEVKLALGRRYAGDKIALTYRRGEHQQRAEAQLVDALLPYEAGFLGILPNRTGSESSRAAIVRFVFPKSPAAQCGIEPGDRIIKWNTTEVSDADQLASLVRRTRPGKTATITIRRGTAEKTLSAKLSAVSDEVPADLPLSSKSAGAAAKPEGAKTDKGPKTGHYRETLPGQGGPSFWAYVPENYSSAESWGLVIWIAPAPDTTESTLLERWKGLCADRRLILVAPAPAEATGFNPNDLVGTKQVIEHIVKTYRIDANRVVVHSFLSAGTFASILTFDNQERIRGLALASSPLDVPPPENNPNFPLKFYFATPDAKPAQDRIHRIAEALRSMKYAVTLYTAASQGRAYLTEKDAADLARWVDSLDRI